MEWSDHSLVSYSWKKINRREIEDNKEINNRGFYFFFAVLGIDENHSTTHRMALNVESVLGDKAQFLTKEETGTMNNMAALVLIDGIAVVDEEKAKKLTLFLLKRIMPFGSVVRNDIYIPMDPTSKLSLG